MVSSVERALAPFLRDLEHSGGPRPVVEASDWQTAVSAESAFLRSEDGTGRGIWVDPAADRAEQVVFLAEQAQEWAIGERAGVGLPTNWPACADHPSTHPLAPAWREEEAVWICPRSGRSMGEIGSFGREA